MPRHYYIGERLKKFLDASPLSVNELAEMLNVSPRQIVMWMQDRVTAEESSVLLIAAYLHKEFHELINDHGQFLDGQEQQIFGFLADEGHLEVLPEMLEMVRKRANPRDARGQGYQTADLQILLKLILDERRRRQSEGQ